MMTEGTTDLGGETSPMDRPPACTACPLHLGEGLRIIAMPGHGPMPCDLLVVGEAPGETEDQRGVPFCGRSGMVLRRALAGALVGAGLQPDAGFGLGLEVLPKGLEMRNRGILVEARVRVTNTARCRPPGNRSPKPKTEAAVCVATHFWAEVASASPRLILLLGNVAAKAVLGRDDFKVTGEDRVTPYVVTSPLTGESYSTRVTFHPAAVLRNRVLGQYWKIDLERVAQELHRGIQLGEGLVRSTR